MDPLDRFREIWLVDTEFVARPAERPATVCVCALELRSGRTVMRFHDELGEAPPYPIDEGVLFVAFAAAADLEVHLSLGWALPAHVLDLRVEHIDQTGIADKKDDHSREKSPRSLIDVLRFYGIPDGDAEQKDRIRGRIIRGGFPFAAAEHGEILRYCLSDAAVLKPLLGRLLPGIRHFGQALRRGAYVAFTAEVCHAGVPFDPWAMGYLRRRDIRQALRLRLVADESLSFGLYEGTTLKQARLAEFVLRRELRWQYTPTGRLVTSIEQFERLAREDGDFAGLAEIQRTLRLLHEFELSSGSDDRARTPIWTFSTITGRMAPAGSAYPFTTPSWTRYMIVPGCGTALAYLDFSSMEFGVGAGLSRCEAMARDYQSGDPYLGLGSEAEFAPRGATAVTHGRLRKRLKPLVLAIQYGGGGGLVSYRLKVDRRAGDRLVNLHHRKYAGYWEWSDRRLYRAYAEGVLATRDGWHCRISSRTPEFTARNWLIQANSAGIFRAAGLMARRLGIKVIAVVHDALLIEAPADQIDEEAARATLCLKRASALFLYGLTLRVDARIVREGERLGDERGEQIWAYVESTLRELDQGVLHNVA